MDSIAISVSLFALFVSALNVFLYVRHRQTALEQRLFDQKNAINLAFAEFEVKGPFAHLIAIPEGELSEYIPKACLLNMQLNLLNDVYKNRETLSPEVVRAHQQWLNNILVPWIISDRHLHATVQLILSTNDIFQSDFIRWFKSKSDWESKTQEAGKA